jgi:hypothetical protein
MVNIRSITDFTDFTDSWTGSGSDSTNHLGGGGLLLSGLTVAHVAGVGDRAA